MKRWIGLAVLLVVGLGALIGLTGRGDDRGSSEGTKSAATGSDSALGAPTVERPVGGGGAAAVAADAAESSPAAPAPAPVPRIGDQVVRTANLELRMQKAEFRRGADRIQAVVGGLGGYTETSDVSASLVTMTVRVPAASYDTAMKRLAALGRVTARTERGDDVSAQAVDLDARIRNLSAQEAVLQGIMDEATTVNDTIVIQQQLFSVREQIEQLQGQRQLLDRQVRDATITVSVVPRGVVVTEPEPQGAIAAAWDDAWDVAVAIVGGTIVVLGALVPLGLLALIGLVIWRLVRRGPGLAASR